MTLCESQDNELLSVQAKSAILSSDQWTDITDLTLHGSNASNQLCKTLEVQPGDYVNSVTFNYSQDYGL